MTSDRAGPPGPRRPPEERPGRTKAGDRGDGEAEAAGESQAPELAPLVRCRHLRTTLAAVAGLPEGEAILKRLPRGLTAEIQRAYGMEWQPMEVELEVTRVIHQALGPARAREFAHDLLLVAFGGPLLRALVETALAVIGPDPAALLRWVPKGWNLVFSGVGRWELEGAGPSSVRVHLCDLPRGCLDGAWLDTLEGTLRAVLTLAGVTGTVTLAAVDRSARRASYQADWTPRT